MGILGKMPSPSGRGQGRVGDRVERDHPCDLCGGRAFEIICRKDRRGRSLTTVVCLRCGLVSHLQVPTDDELRTYYATRYRRDYGNETTPAARRVLRAWKTGHNTLRRLRPHLRPADRILEVGAGVGCTVKAFRANGYDALGVEPCRIAQEFAARKLGVPVDQGTLADVPRWPAYDVVLLLHVIEHLNSPRRALEHVHALLNEGGRLYVECPNVGAPHAGPGKLFHVAHIYNLTPCTLTMLAKACGFRVVASLSRARGRNIRILFEKTNERALRIDRRSYSATMAAVNRYNLLTYHLRPGYWQERAATLIRHASEWLWTKRRLTRIPDSCDYPAASGPNVLASSGRLTGDEAGSRPLSKAG